jgi:hypothetical protein
MNKHHNPSFAPLMALLLTLTAVGVLLPACQTTYAPGAEPFVVESERTIQVSFALVDSFLAWEYQSRATVPPAVTEAADKLRVTYPWAHESAVAALRSYKRTRNPDDRARLLPFLSGVSDALRVALLHLPESQARLAYEKAGAK